MHCLLQRNFSNTIKSRKLKEGKMLNENIKTLRKSKGLSQEELAVKINVVRQTISKRENGLSVPDSNMLISLSEIFETPVSKILGEEIGESEIDDIKVISEKLEIINLQLARNTEAKRKTINLAFKTLVTITIVIFIMLLLINSQYMYWNTNDFEYTLLKTFLHGFEWLFIRIFPFLLFFGIVGSYLTRKKN